MNSSSSGSRELIASDVSGGVFRADGSIVCWIAPRKGVDRRRAKADRDIIVQAVNAHDSLVNACQRALGDLQSGHANLSTFDALFSALAAAGKDARQLVQMLAPDVMDAIAIEAEKPGVLA